LDADQPFSAVQQQHTSQQPLQQQQQQQANDMRRAASAFAGSHELAAAAAAAAAVEGGNGSSGSGTGLPMSHSEPVSHQGSGIPSQQHSGSGMPPPAPYAGAAYTGVVHDAQSGVGVFQGWLCWQGTVSNQNGNPHIA
jgi:hypothetical protein